MTALTASRLTPRRDGRTINVGVAAGVTILQGGLAILAAGYARPGRTGQGGNDTAKINDVATYCALGVAQATVTGGVADGDVKVDVETGVWCFGNSASYDAITDADIGKAAYLVDDQTVAKTSVGGTRAVAGVIVDFDADGVWVDVGPRNAAIPRRVTRLPFFINETDTLAGTSAELISPVAGVISRMSVIVQKAVTTGGDVTAAVGTTAVVGLTCTIADAATKGTVVTDTPTAGDASTVVAAGDRIQVIPAAAFATAGAVSGFVEISH